VTRVGLELRKSDCGWMGIGRRISEVGYCAFIWSQDVHVNSINEGSILLEHASGARPSKLKR
jgi:hypothetical protein